MYAFPDTETTGFARGGVQPRLVSIAWMIAEDPGRPRVFKHSIIKPEGFTIPQAAAAVHGITTERALAQGLPLTAVLHDFAYDLRTLLPRAIVAHNVAYDIPIIAAEFTQIRIADPCQGRATYCTMIAARDRWPGESAKLGDVYARVFRSTLQNAHNASADVWACAQIFFALQGVVTKNIAPILPGPHDEKGECGRLIEAVLEWAETRIDFDTSFVENLQACLTAGRHLTDRQKTALHNIIHKWNIEV